MIHHDHYFSGLSKPMLTILLTRMSTVRPRSCETSELLAVLLLFIEWYRNFSTNSQPATMLFDTISGHYRPPPRGASSTKAKPT